VVEGRNSKRLAARGARPTLLTRNFSSHFDLVVSAKACRGFFGTEKMRDGEIIWTWLGRPLFFRLAINHPRSRHVKREEYSWMKFSAELTAR
jgi:hypothetical protein